MRILTTSPPAFTIPNSKFPRHAERSQSAAQPTLFNRVYARKSLNSHNLFYTRSTPPSTQSPLCAKAIAKVRGDLGVCYKKQNQKYLC